MALENEGQVDETQDLGDNGQDNSQDDGVSTDVDAGQESDEGNDGEEEHYDLSDFGYEDVDALWSDLQSIKNLKEELQQLQEYKSGPKFASDRQKFLYEWSGQVEGMELDRARQLLTICGADLNAMPDQQKRYEAFKLDPALKGLSRDEIKELFNAQERELFGDPDDDSLDPSTKKLRDIKAKQATAQAAEKLSKIRAEWDSARTAVKSPEQTARERQEYRQSLDGALSKFVGIPFQMRASGPNEGETFEGSLNFKIDRENHMPIIKDALADPAGWWDRKLEEFGVMQNGELASIEKFAEIVSLFEFNQDLMNQAYQQGREDQFSHGIKNGRNLSKTNEVRDSNQTETPKLVGQAAANKAFMQAMGILK